MIRYAESYLRNQQRSNSRRMDNRYLCQINLEIYSGTPVYFTCSNLSITYSSYPIHYLPDSPESAEQKAKKDAFASHENPSNGTLILGHASPLNFFVLTDDEKYVVTADRDEHVRVSRYPKGYIIEMYCLGHLKWVPLHRLVEVMNLTPSNKICLCVALSVF